MEAKTRIFSGSIIAVCAIGIAIINYLTHENADSYIMPFILLCLSGILFTRKPKKEEMQYELSKKQRNIILSITSVTLVLGIVVFFITLL